MQDLRVLHVARSHDVYLGGVRVTAITGSPGKRIKVVLYNPRAVFFTMPLALLAIGSELDPDISTKS